MMKTKGDVILSVDIKYTEGISIENMGQTR